MKSIKFLVVSFFVLCFLMPSCTETYYTTKKVNLENEARIKWKGATKQEIIREFGPPNSERSDGGNGTMLVYNMDRSDGETINRSCYIWFYLNSEDICTDLKSDYFWRYEKEKHTEIDQGMTTGVVLSSILLGLTIYGLIYLSTTGI